MTAWTMILSSDERDLYDRPPVMEDCKELCFRCLEYPDCPIHPDRNQLPTSIRLFTNDDFALIDRSRLVNVTCIDRPSTHVTRIEKKHCEKRVCVRPSSTATTSSDPAATAGARAAKYLAIMRQRKEKDASADENNNTGDESVFETVSPPRHTPGPRKKFARFREKQFICDVCDLEFTMKQNVASHLMIFHLQDDGTMRSLKKQLFRCKECNQMFRSPNAALKHHKRKHRKLPPKAPSDCEECGKSFASPFQLKEHIVITHLKEKNFVCEQCHQKFGRRGGLRRHIQMVHQNHLHKCPYSDCDHPGYKCSKALTAHIRSVHTNIRPYECDDCGKSFVRRNDLKMHQMTHAKQLMFHCKCGSHFRRQIYLRKHQKSCRAASCGDDGDASEGAAASQSLEKEESDESLSVQDQEQDSV